MKSPLSLGLKRAAGKTTVASRLTDFLRQSGEQVLAARRHPMLRMRPIQLDLDSLQSVGGPLMILIADIDEDPDQPRLEFDDEPLKELAATIAERGVRSPVSVRPHPSSPGRWLLNYGARRLRAAKLAGLSEVPAFEDKSADSYDQVIENEQREGLKPLELALFVKREMDKGVTQADIARRLGKSQTYITFVRAMIDPPPWLMDVYRSGKCRNAAQLYELRRLYEAKPECVEKQLDSAERIGRVDIERLKRDDGVSTTEPTGARLLPPGDEGEPQAHVRLDPHERPARLQPSSQGPLVLTAKYEGREVRVLLGSLPSNTAAVYVTSSATAGRTVADVNALTNLKLARSTT
jgi:ParB family transcriptional regulator, chromosome partitioning protein